MARFDVTDVESAFDRASAASGGHRAVAAPRRMREFNGYDLNPELIATDTATRAELVAAARGAGDTEPPKSCATSPPGPRRLAAVRGSDYFQAPGSSSWLHYLIRR